MAGFSSNKPVEEQEVQTEETDSVKTTEEEMRTEEADPAKTVEEKEVRTEEADSAKTTDEEVRTEEADSVKTTEEEMRTEEADPAKTAEEEEVRTEEDDPKEEAIESLLDSALNLSIEDEESDKRIENPQEDSTMIPRSDQTMDHGSTLVASGSLVTQPPYQNPRLNQIPRTDQLMIQQQRFTIPNRGFNQSFGMQQLRLPMLRCTLPQPQPLWPTIVHSYAVGSGPKTIVWRPEIIRPLMPNETTFRGHAFVDQNQMFVPRPLFVASQTDSVKATVEEMRTEEADPAKTTEEEEVQTGEEEATLLDSDPNISALNPRIEQKESDEGNENPQEDSKMIPRSDQTMNSGSTLVASDQNRPLCVIMPPEGNVIQPPYQNPLLNQIPRTDQLMMRNPYRVLTPVAFVQNNFNQPFGMQPQYFPIVLTTHPRDGWLINDQSLAAGTGPSSTAAWRRQIIRPLMPNETGPASVDQQHPMANQLANIVRLQNQMFVPRPLFVAAQTYFAQNPRLNALASMSFRYYPYMRPSANQLNLRMPHFRRDQMFTLTSPSGQPRSFVVITDHFIPQQKLVCSLDDALVFAPLSEVSAAAAHARLNHQQIQQQFNQGQHVVFPQASPSAIAPRAELYHQQMQELQPQTLQPTQSQGFNTGQSSRQGQDQQQP